MVRFVFRFAIGLETYVVTLNAWPNVDILVDCEKSTSRNTYLLTKENFVLTGVNNQNLPVEHPKVVFVMGGIGPQFSSLYFLIVFVSITENDTKSSDLR